MTILHQTDLGAHLFELGCALNGVRAMSHRPLRPEPPACTTESIAETRQHQRLERQTVIAALAYDYCPERWRGKDSASYFDAPPDVQARCDRIARIFFGLLDPERESLAWHAANQRDDPRAAVQAFLRVLATAGERPEVG